MLFALFIMESIVYFTMWIIVHIKTPLRQHFEKGTWNKPLSVLGGAESDLPSGKSRDISQFSSAYVTENESY